VPPLPLAGEDWGEGEGEYNVSPSPVSSPPWGEEIKKVYFLGKKGPALVSEQALVLPNLLF